MSNQKIYSVVVKTVSGRISTLEMSKDGLECWKALYETKGGEVMAVLPPTQKEEKRIRYDERF